MKVLIIEDEARAASQLQSMLGNCGFEYDLLGIIDTIEDAVKWFEINSSADLVFMDIQLADGLSFEIFQKIEVEAPIIFTTAYDQYAIQAFKVNSIDYLLKPIQQRDLKKALDKFRKSKKQLAMQSEVIKGLLNSLQKIPRRRSILVKQGRDFVQFDVDEVTCFYSENSITFGMMHGQRFIVEETLDQLFSTLDFNEFYKINRGQIVSKQGIEKISPYFNHRLKLSIKDGRDMEFIVSRKKTNEFKNWLNS